MTIAKKLFCSIAVCAGALLCDAPAHAAELPADYMEHLKAAKDAARFDWVGVLARNCVAPKVGPAVGNYNTDPGRDIWYAEPQKVFDNLYFLGTKYHTAWALTTSDGIIIIDTLYNYAVGPEIVEGLQKMKLDPAKVKYVLITHGHGDHDEGAKYFQDRGAHVMLGAGDWDMIEKAAKPMPGGNPKRDLIAKDGEVLKLGDTEVKIITTPGHTPGSYGLLFKSTDRGQTYMIAYASGTAFGAYDKTFFDTFIASQRKLAAAAAAAGATVLISNHNAFDDAWTKSRLAAWRPGNQPNPFVVGAEGVAGYFKVMEACSMASKSLLPQPNS